MVKQQSVTRFDLKLTPIGNAVSLLLKNVINPSQKITFSAKCIADY